MSEPEGGSETGAGSETAAGSETGGGSGSDLRSPPRPGLSARDRSALYELSRRVNRRLLLVLPVVVVLFAASVELAAPAVRGGLVGLSGGIGIGVGWLLLRPLNRLYEELGLTTAQARAVVAEERARRRAEARPVVARRRALLDAAFAAVLVALSIAVMIKVWWPAGGDQAADVPADASVALLPAPAAVISTHGVPVHSVAFDPDGAGMAIGDHKGAVWLWDIAGGKNAATLKGHTGQVDSLAYSPDGRLLATGGHDRVVRLWDVATRRPVATLTGHSDWVRKLVFSPDGRTLTSFDTKWRRWAVPGGRLTGTGPESGSVLAYSPDGRYLALRPDRSTGMHLQDLTTARTTDLRRYFTYQVAFSPDGRTFAIAETLGDVRLRDPATGRETATLKGHTGRMSCLAFSPDGRSLATGSSDMTVRLWDLTTGRTVSILGGHPFDVVALAFSSDGKMIATASTDQIRLWRR